MKIKFPLEDDPLGIEAEWMWAKPMGGNAFEVDNSPFHLYGISWRDVVSITLSDDTLCFEKILSKSGHRTLRARLPSEADHASFLCLWPDLKTLGCSFEGSNLERPLYAIDVPPGVDIASVTDYLAQWERQGLLEYEEADFY